MIRKYTDIELQVERNPEGKGYWVRASIPGRAEWCVFEDPFSAEELDALQDAVSGERTRDARSGHVSAKELGRRLFERVFTGPVRDLLNECLRQPGWRWGARIRLRPAPEISPWPWELLHDRDDFLALSVRTPVVRHLHSKSLRARWTAYPLRVLVVISSPRGCEPLDGERELKEIRDALGWRVSLGFVKVEKLKPATLEALEERLGGERFHVFHFVGHGRFNEGQGVLLFEDEDGRSDPVDGERLGRVLGQRDAVRLAVLNACEGARGSPENPFAGVAQSLVRKGIPAVVAMQHPIADDMAVRFARRLYGALARGRPVDWAVTRARHALHAAGSGLDWAVPVLFLSSRHGRLFRWRPSFLLVVILALILGLRFFGYPEWQSKATVLETIGQRCPPVEGLDMEFVRVPSGSFVMGSAEGNERPPHEVQISRPFCLGVYEVTQKQWEAVMGPNTLQTEQRGDDLPVTFVSWEEARDFLDRVSRGAGPGVVLRLPTEAEWEYAARGPEEGLPVGSNCQGDGRFDGLAPVGSLRPNSWGLHDMYGNVWELVQDWYGDYPAGSHADPTGPSTGEERVKRGGSYRSASTNCRPARRNAQKPGSHFKDVGFRVLRELDAGSGGGIR